VRNALVVAILCGIGVPLLSQEPPAQTFRTSVRLVPINVVVHDRDGKPVEGLTAADFTITEDGVEHPLALFAVESRTAAQSDAPPPLPGIFTNRIEGAAAGAVTVLLFDRVNTSAMDQRRAHEHLVRFLKSLRPADRVGLYVLDPGALHVLHDFSRDATSLLRAVDRVAGQTSGALAAADERNLPADPSGDASGGLADFLAQSDAVLTAMQAHFELIRARDTTDALEALARHLAGVRGRKNVIWISGGFPLVIHERDGIRNMSPDVLRATRALSDSDIAIYPVDARGVLDPFVTRPGDKVQVMRSLEESRRLLDASSMIAEQTGGRAFYSTNDLGTAITRANSDADLTYVLGYLPVNDRWDGRFRAIRVSVNRRNVDVRHRRGYFAHPPGIATAEEQAALLNDALRSPLEATGLPMSVAASPGPASPPAPLKVQLEILLHGGAVSLQPAGEFWEGGVHLTAAQGFADGRLLRLLDRTVNLRLSPEQREPLLQEGLTLTITIEVQADAHHVRLAARDLHSGRLGSVTIPASGFRGGSASR
jgi:VWFA-related protein